MRSELLRSPATTFLVVLSAWMPATVVAALSMDPARLGVGPRLVGVFIAFVIAFIVGLATSLWVLKEFAPSWSAWRAYRRLGAQRPEFGAAWMVAREAKVSPQEALERVRTAVSAAAVGLKTEAMGKARIALGPAIAVLVAAYLWVGQAFPEPLHRLPAVLLLVGLLLAAGSAVGARGYAVRRRVLEDRGILDRHPE